MLCQNRPTDTERFVYMNLNLLGGKCAEKSTEPYLTCRNPLTPPKYSEEEGTNKSSQENRYLHLSYVQEKLNHLPAACAVVYSSGNATQEN